MSRRLLSTFLLLIPAFLFSQLTPRQLLEQLKPNGGFRFVQVDYLGDNEHVVQLEGQNIMRTNELYVVKVENRQVADTFQILASQVDLISNANSDYMRINGQIHRIRKDKRKSGIFYFSDKLIGNSFQVSEDPFFIGERSKGYNDYSGFVENEEHFYITGHSGSVVSFTKFSKTRELDIEFSYSTELFKSSHEDNFTFSLENDKFVCLINYIRGEMNYVIFLREQRNKISTASISFPVKALQTTAVRVDSGESEEIVINVISVLRRTVRSTIITGTMNDDKLVVADDRELNATILYNDFPVDSPQKPAFEYMYIRTLEDSESNRYVVYQRYTLSGEYSYSNNFLIVKVAGAKQLWLQSIRRDDFNDVRFSISGDQLMYTDVEDVKFFDNAGNYLGTTISMGRSGNKSQVCPLEVLIDLDTGEKKWKRIE